MGYVIGIIIAAALIGAVLWKIWKDRRPHETGVVKRRGAKPAVNRTYELVGGIRIELLPSDTDLGGNLVKISDSGVKELVTANLSQLLQLANATTNLVALNQGLYKVIIPPGAKLADSRNIPGAKRGLYHAEGGIKGHADWIEVNDAVYKTSNAVAAAMSIASIVVGQYYLAQINAEIGEISKGVSEIVSFLDNEYKSRVFALLRQIDKSLKFYTDILHKDEKRKIEIIKLENLENDCIQLLDQANLTIGGFVKENNLSFNEYIKLVDKSYNWYLMQRVLLEVLRNIADLKYVFYLGNVSMEECSYHYENFSKEVQIISAKLKEWHEHQIEAFEMDLDNCTWKSGEGCWSKDAGKIPEDAVGKIVAMIKGYDTSQKALPMDLFHKDSEIIFKEGEIYYLLPEEDQ